MNGFADEHELKIAQLEAELKKMKEPKTQRWVIEGEWSGYRSSQQRIVHRSITTNAKLAAWVQDTFSITYTDGTCLMLTCRKLGKGERVTGLRESYTSLIEDCYRANVSSVAELQKARKGVPE